MKKPFKCGLGAFLIFLFLLLGMFSALAQPLVSFEVETSMDAPENAPVPVAVRADTSGRLELPETVLPESVSDEQDSASLFAVALFEGEGTENSPYLIQNADDLLNLSTSVNSGSTKYTGAYYLLTADIDLGGAEWLPIGSYRDTLQYRCSFHGVFDGDGHTISNYKITEGGQYIGLFGLIYNGSVKNLTVSDVTIQLSHSNHIFAGALVGRFLSIGSQQNAVIENCHVQNSTVNITSTNASIYAGGLIGYLHASEGASIQVTGSSSNAVLDTAVSGYNSSASNHIISRTGGFVGYVGCIDSTIRMDQCAALGRIHAVSSIRNLASDNVEVGGFAGFAGTSGTGVVSVRQSYSTGGVFAEGVGEVFAGGFFGYLVDSSSGSSVNDSYTSSNVYAISTGFTAYPAGFAGLAATYAGYTMKISSCYTLANVYDTGSSQSEGGKFIAYTEGGAEFVSCYALAQSNLVCLTPFTPVEREIDSADAASLTAYDGFSDSVWAIGDAPYTYPVLLTNPHLLSDFSVTFWNSGTIHDTQSGISFGSAAQTPEETPVSNRLFSHWSLYPDGPAVSVEETAVNSDTCFYANFAEDYVTYTISFSACGEIFYSLSLPYQSAIPFPEAPLKPADAVFRYSFSHWSMTENGAPMDTAAVTVQQDTTFYAVYAQTDVNIWDGISADVFSDGDGSAEKPYEIKNGYQLYYLSCHLADSPALAAAHYLLIRDIDLGGNEWLPIGTLETPFTGTFDGSGYTVSNFKIISDETAALGLFGYIANADISRLGVSDFDITVTADKQTELYAGAIAGIMTADVTGGVARLTECSSDGAINIYAELTYAGGLVGKAACTDDAYIYLENSYSRCAVTAHSEKLSMAGGIAGTFHAQSSGASCMDRSYAVGTVAALSETAAYAGGIVGFLYDDGGYIDGLVSLNAAETGTVRNCFAAGSASAQTDSGLSCYAGYIYAYKNQPATVTGCAAYASMNVSGAAIADTEDLLLETELASFYDRDFLAGLGFDVESIWTVPDNDFPTLSTADTVKNVYRVLSAVFNPAQGTMSVSLYIGYRDVASYTVLAGAYDERGKMIGFRAVTVTDPERLQTIDLSLDGIENAVSAKVSVVDSASFALLENVLSWEN